MDIMKYCIDELYKEMEKAEVNMNAEMEKAKDNMKDEMEKAKENIMNFHQEMETGKKSIFLIENHLRQIVEKKEYETVV